MKNIFLKSALVFTALVSGFTYAQEKTYSLSLSNPMEPAILDIEVHTGSVTVVGYDGKTIEITANVSPVKDNPLTKQQKKIKKQINRKMSQHQSSQTRSTEGLKVVKSSMLHLEIEEENNEVEITSETMNQHVDLVIKVPSKSSVSIELYQGGGIEIDNVHGELELESYQGGVNAKNVSGPIVAETYTQDIVIAFSDFNNNTPTSLTSHAGNIDISLASKIKANVNVQTFQGEIFSGLTTDFVASDEVQQKNKGDKQKVVIGGIMQAKVNGGGQDLSLITYMGNLYIRQAK